jgi:hypothetical protein
MGIRYTGFVQVWPKMTHEDPVLPEPVHQKYNRHCPYRRNEPETLPPHIPKPSQPPPEVLAVHDLASK